MEKQEFRLNLLSIHMHQLLQHIVENFQLQLLEKTEGLTYSLNATDDAVEVDEVHFYQHTFQSY
jgi:two-component system phosphate regulon sensor histidine kinase PhoR